MKKVLTLAICTGLLSPFLASAQFVTVGASTALFDGIVSDMANAPGAPANHPLLVPEGDSGSLYTKFYWDDVAKDFVVGSHDFTSADNWNFEFINPNLSQFVLEGNLDVGFVANENWDLDELYVNAWDSGFNGPNPDSEVIFNYESEPGNQGGLEGADTPPAARRISLTASGQPFSYIVFEHRNLEFPVFDPRFQDDEVRFRMYQRVNMVNQQKVYVEGEYFAGMNDQNKNFDNDADDGIFYFIGDIRAVPEPSQIAGIALLGLLGGLFLRRRFKNKK